MIIIRRLRGSSFFAVLRTLPYKQKTHPPRADVYAEGVSNEASGSLVPDVFVEAFKSQVELFLRKPAVPVEIVHPEQAANELPA